MKKILAVLAGGLMISAFVVAQAQQPAPKSDAEKAAAAKAKAAEDLGKSMDKAVANYRKNKGMPMDAKPAAMGAKAAAKK